MDRLRKILRNLTAWIPGLRPRPDDRLDLLSLFHLFQKVLETNNKALEIITDMGEKISESYIFDTNYLQKSYRELTATIQTSISSFTTLTGNRYAIEPAFARIHALIIGIIEGYSTGASDLVIPFTNVQWDRARDVGGKNYHLAEMANSMHMAVPDGFALTGRAFDEFIRANGLVDNLDRLRGGASPEALDEIIALIQKGAMPLGLEQGIDQAVSTILAKHGASARLAVRSSAEEEDDFFSFAGQFETVLNVPLQREALFSAYKTVLASLFFPNAVTYQIQMGYAPGSIKMPVGFLLMVDAVASGVMYTADPIQGNTGLILINAAWGLGPSVVDGRTDPDLYRVEKDDSPRIIDARIGRKEMMTVLDQEQRATETETPADQRQLRCLGDEQILELAGYGMAIESYFKGPQDVEWSLGRDGTLYLLQARPLKLSEEDKQSAAAAPLSQKKTDEADYPVLLKNQGLIVRKGIAAGKAFILKNLVDLDTFPKGAVLVAKHDSPHFIRVMPLVAAIITDTGAMASHMASVCREFKIPTLVNTGHATDCIRHGTEITIDCDDEGNSTVYEGLVGSVIDRRLQTGVKMEDLYEFRRKKYLLRYISPLNLVNPLEDEFTPEKCRTLHDILRFIHEKSIQRIIESSSQGARGSNLFRLKLSVPTGIQVIDLGGGVATGSDHTIGLEQITSLPLEAILTGMTYPGAWSTAAAPLQINDLMGSMLRMPDLNTEGIKFTDNNLAIASREYVNLSLRFGYHFNLLDSYCSERTANNHVYFRFVGGATDIIKRSRRLRFIDTVLQEYGFISKTKGDFITARVSHIEQEEVLRILDMAGRLIAFTRQLDAELLNDTQVETFARRFLEGSYDIKTDAGRT